MKKRRLALIALPLVLVAATAAAWSPANRWLAERPAKALARQFYIAASSGGSFSAQCSLAGQVADAYLAIEDKEQYQYWLTEQGAACALEKTYR